MRMVLYILIIAAVFFAPVERVDIAKMQPVEAVALCEAVGQVLLITDTQDVGRGETVEQALENLKEAAPAIIYLDTAQFLLVGESMQEYAVGLLPHLKKSVVIGPYNGGDVAEEGRFLAVHREKEKPRG